MSLAHVAFKKVMLKLNSCKLCRSCFCSYVQVSKPRRRLCTTVFLPHYQSSQLNPCSARKVSAFCKQASTRLPLQSTLVNSPANHEPCSSANRVFKIQGFVCKHFLPSPPLPAINLFWVSPHFPCKQNNENPVTRSFFAPKPQGNACYAGYFYDNSQGIH